MADNFEIQNSGTDLRTLIKSMAEWVGRTTAWDVIYPDIQKKVEETRKELLKDTYPVVFDINSRPYKNKLQNIITLIDNIDKKIISRALEIFKAKNPSGNLKLELAECYLMLGEQMKKLFIMIQQLTDDNITDFENSTDFDMSNIQEHFSVMRQNGGRYVISQGSIKAKGTRESLKQVFQIKKNKEGVLTLIISNTDKAWAGLVEQQNFDLIIQQHYIQFKQYTAEHYFSSSLSGKYLYSILGSINSSKAFRTKFWKWYHTGEINGNTGGTSGYEMLHRGESFENFKEVLQSLLNTMIIQEAQEKYLKTFIEAIANGGKDKMSKGSLNWGHVAEAFERHLEEHHGFTETGYPRDLENPDKPIISYYPDPDEPGDAFTDWMQHLILSQGKLPGYFGPDTDYAQVKQFSSSGGSLNVINRNQLIYARVQLLKILSEIQKGSDLVNYHQQLLTQYAMDSDAMNKMGSDLMDHTTQKLKQELL